MQAVKGERERPVVMAVLEALTGVLRTCGTLAVQPPERINDLCIVLKTVLQKKVSGGRAAVGRGGVRSQKSGFSKASSPALLISPPPQKGKAGEPTLTELCLPQTACQNAEEEEEDDDEDQVRVSDERGPDHLVSPHRASSGQCAQPSLEEPRLVREVGDYQEGATLIPVRW